MSLVNHYGSGKTIQTWKRDGRYLARIVCGQRPPEELPQVGQPVVGRMVLGDYATEWEAVAAAELTMLVTDRFRVSPRTLCGPDDIDRVRQEIGKCAAV